MPDFASTGHFRDVMILGRRIATALERIADALDHDRDDAAVPVTARPDDPELPWSATLPGTEEGR